MWGARTIVPEGPDLCTETIGIRSRWAVTGSMFVAVVTAITVTGGNCSVVTSGNSAAGSEEAEK